MLEVIIFIILLLLCSLGLLATLYHLARFGIKKIRKSKMKKTALRLKEAAIVTAAAIIIMSVFIPSSQLLARTPPILDKQGKILRGSIAELQKVSLNGHDEWISMRGKNKNKPILLFLAGGPGGTEMAAERYHLAALEDNFVVVNWEQPGSCKSFGAIKTENLTVKTYIQDGYALTNYLCKRFHKQKIYLVGESWGSALGIFLVKNHPQRYYSFIGTGQMVDFTKTEIIDYTKAMDIAKAKKDLKLIAKLKENGKPPYYGDDVTWKSEAYFDCLNTYMESNPKIYNSGFHTLKYIFSSEYGIIDKINYMGGLYYTFNWVYPQLYSTDLRKDYTKIDVPVYFFIGRQDINVPTSLSVDYYNCLKAPDKKIVWFEHSGHSPWINEPEKFVKELLKVSVKKH